MVERNNLILTKKDLKTNEYLTRIDVQTEGFDRLMGIYDLAMKKVEKEIEKLKYILNDYYGYSMINSVSSRIKQPESIINKMKKKNYALNYKELVENIKDVAGVRVVCFFKDDLLKIKSMLEVSEVLKVSEEKDYFTKPKKSGYSGYHLIVEVPVEYEENIFIVNVEIQIRTMAMDFWSTLEHKTKYKTRYKVSKFDSIKLVCYAKIINKLDEKMAIIFKKQFDKKII
ncbi:MAG: GTP pyrophosphokinase family protein [Clostridia bacterium]|nr:GTP pyrophosphokinase family protein [Clostridia bacterium]